MKLLILTQKVDINDDVLGFMHGWIAEFAKYCDKITVICLQKGEHELPGNVKVLSLGKESEIQNSKLQITNKFKIQFRNIVRDKIFRKLLYYLRFYKYIWQERNNYNKVFVHMNPGYVVLGGLLWKMWRKKIGLWYTHKSVDFKLRIAEKMANVIFTASKESFRLPSRKVKVMGHGIDTAKCKMQNAKCKINDRFKIITVGRISPIKDYETLINAVEILCRNKALPCLTSCSDLRVDIIGSPAMPEDEKYLAELKKIIAEKKLEKIINFIGSVPNKNIVQYYNNADLFVNLCPTGGMDKAVLEAMACGVSVIVLNKAFADVLGSYKDDLILINKSKIELAEKIKKIIALSQEQRKKIGKELRQVVIKEHSLDNLIKKIVFILNE